MNGSWHIGVGGVGVIAGLSWPMRVHIQRDGTTDFRSCCKQPPGNLRQVQRGEAVHNFYWRLTNHGWFGVDSHVESRHGNFNVDI